MTGPFIGVACCKYMSLMLYSRQDLSRCTPKPSLLSESYKYVLALSIYNNFMVHALMDRERAMVGSEPICISSHSYTCYIYRYGFSTIYFARFVCLTEPIKKNQCYIIHKNNFIRHENAWAFTYLPRFPNKILVSKYLGSAPFGRVGRETGNTQYFPSGLINMHEEIWGRNTWG